MTAQGFPSGNWFQLSNADGKVEGTFNLIIQKGFFRDNFPANLRGKLFIFASCSTGALPNGPYSIPKLLTDRGAAWMAFSNDLTAAALNCNLDYLFRGLTDGKTLGGAVAGIPNSSLFPRCKESVPLISYSEPKGGYMLPRRNSPECLPTQVPTAEPTAEPTAIPTNTPSPRPTARPSALSLSIEVRMLANPLNLDQKLFVSTSRGVGALMYRSDVGRQFIGTFGDLISDSEGVFQLNYTAEFGELIRVNINPESLTSPTGPTSSSQTISSSVHAGASSLSSSYTLGYSTGIGGLGGYVEYPVFGIFFYKAPASESDVWRYCFTSSGYSGTTCTPNIPLQ